VLLFARGERGFARGDFKFRSVRLLSGKWIIGITSLSPSTLFSKDVSERKASKLACGRALLLLLLLLAYGSCCIRCSGGRRRENFGLEGFADDAAVAASASSTPISHSLATRAIGRQCVLLSTVQKIFLRPSFTPHYWPKRNEKTHTEAIQLG
jgi:hypothetical protein